MAEGDEEKPATKLDSNQLTQGSDRNRGLAYYRWRTPYEATEAAFTVYEVTDRATGEMVGRLKQHSGNPDGPVRIDRVDAVIPREKVDEFNAQSGDLRMSVDAAASFLWNLAYPRKTRFWYFMRMVVITFDSAWNVADLLLRTALVLFAIVFVAAWIPFLWESRDLIQVIVLQWLEGFID